MHSEEIYTDERWGEMEAAAQRRMGCCPLGRMISRVITKCNGRDARTRKERMDFSYSRPTARTVTVTNTASHRPAYTHTAPPEPAQAYAVLPGAPFAAASSLRAGGKPRKKKKSKRVRFTQDGPAPPPHVAHILQHAPEGTSTAAAGSGHAHHQPAGAEPYSPAAHGHGYLYGYGRYAPSPLTRWEMLGAGGTPRRYEYFSGEYRWCYPTPVREGIYSIATDANRLTTIFSEENPNACTIV